MSEFRSHVVRCQSDALQLQSLIATISACVGDPRREEFVEELVAQALTMATELYVALDSVNVPSS